MGYRRWSLAAIGAWAAVAALAVALFAIGVAMPQDSVHADWAPKLIGAGVWIFVIVTVCLIVGHIRWPQWITSVRLQKQIYRTPLKHQSLRELADADAQNPVPLLRIEDRNVISFDRGDGNRPALQLRFRVFNGAVHTISARVRGTMSIGGNPLREQITPDGGDGWTTIARGADNTLFVFKQYLGPDAIADAAAAEWVAGKLQQFGCGGVSLEVQAIEPDGSDTVRRKPIGDGFTRA